MANNKLFKKASVNAIENLAKELAEAKLLATHEPEWSTPIKFNERMPMGSCGIGLYKIIHKDGMITMYVGQGGVGARKNTHMRVFKNKGKMIKYGNTTWTNLKLLHKCMNLMKILIIGYFLFVSYIINQFLRSMKNY